MEGWLLIWIVPLVTCLLLYMKLEHGIDLISPSSLLLEQEHPAPFFECKFGYRIS